MKIEELETLEQVEHKLNKIEELELELFIASGDVMDLEQEITKLDKIEILRPRKLSEYVNSLIASEGGDANGFYSGILRGISQYPETDELFPQAPNTEIQVPDGWSGFWNICTDEFGFPGFDGFCTHSSEPDPDWEIDAL